MTLEELKVVISAETEPLKKGIADVKKQMGGLQNETSKTTSGIKSMFSKLVKGVIALKIGQKIGQAITGGIKEAMNVEAAVQQIKRIMGESTNQFLKWSNTQAIAFNMSKAQALKYGAVFGNLISGFAKSSGEAMTYTTDLLKASSIIASSTGRSMQDVMERIRSGLLGNTEAIEDLGVNVNIAMIESTEAFKKFANGRSWNQIDFQTQQQIRLMAILEQTHKKYGDTVAQNTSSQLQQLVAILGNVKLSLGQAFLPIVQVVLPVLIKLAQGLNYVMNIIAQFSQALFGKSTGKQQAQNTNAQAKAMANLGNATEKAGKQAKGALAGFDEINSLSFNKGGSDGNETPTGDVGVPAMSMPGLETGSFLDSTVEVSEKVQEMADSVKKCIGTIDFTPLLNSFNRLKESISPIIDTVGNYLKWYLTDILVPLAKWTIGDALPAFFNLLSETLDVVNPLIKSFSNASIWLWDNFLEPIASWTGGVIVDVLNGLADTLSTIGNWMSNNQQVVDAITISIVAFFGAWKVAELFSFIEQAGGIVGAFNKIKTAIYACTIAKIKDKFETIALNAMYAKDFIVSVASGTAALIKQAGRWTINTGLKIADTVATGAMTVATTAWNVICGIATAVTTAFGAALAFLTSPIGLVITAIAAVIAIVVLLIKHWDDVKKAASVAWDWITKVWSEASQWFSKNVTTPISGAFSKAWEGIKSGFTKAFDFITKGIKTYINIYIIVVESFVNAFIKGINFIVRALNKIKFNIPNWVPVIGGKSFGFNLPSIKEISIPKLAKGAIIDNPTLAMVGEAGKEAVMPLENNTGWIDELASKIKAKGGNDGPLTVILRVGKTELARVVADGINDLKRQNGELILDI